MQTTTQQPARQRSQSKPKVDRVVRLIVGLNDEGKLGLFSIIETTHLLKGPKVKVDEYFLDKIPSDFGEAFLVEKRDYWLLKENEQEPRYHVLIENEQDRSCTCPGFTYHGHCRHIKSLLALRKAGKI